MIIARIESAELSIATYRTARRLLDRADQASGALTLSHDELRAVVGTDSDGTARSHLIQLQAAGLIAYRRNSTVQVWFADWRPDNVVKHSDQQGSAVISGDRQTRDSRDGDRQTRETEQQSVISGDRQARDSRATRSNRASGDHLPHTHADARSGWLVGSTTDPDLDNQPTNPDAPKPPQTAPTLSQTDPEGVELSRKLLASIRMIAERADRLAVMQPFEHIREAVAFWWLNRRSVGGSFQNEPGVIVYWFDNPSKSAIPPMADEFRRSELYLNHRRPAEIAADIEAQQQAELRSLGPPVAPAAAPASPYLDDHAAWQVLQGDPLVADLGGLAGVGAVDGVTLFRFAARDPLKVQWLERQIGAQLRKALKARLGHDCLVEIVSQEVT